MYDGPMDMDALLSAKQIADYAGVTTAAVCNWAKRTYRDALTGEVKHLLPVATDEQGNEIRDERGRARYRLRDAARADARMHERAQRVAERITRRSAAPLAA